MSGAGRGAARGICYNRWMRRAVRVAKASLPLAALALGGTSCGGCSSKRQERAFERELAAQLSKQLGVGGALGPAGQLRPGDVRCEGEAPDRCIAKVAGAALPIALRRDGEQVHWQLEGLVVSGPELERQLSEELAALGLAAKPSCGAPLQPVIPGERVSCSLSELGLAWATVHRDGSYTWELALGEAQAERSRSVDEAQLDLLSRALDREAGTDEPGDDEPGDDDEDDHEGDHEGEASEEGALGGSSVPSAAPPAAASAAASAGSRR